MAKICIVGPSVKYFSGISAYTIRLANALSSSHNVSVLLLRNLLPRFLYPGKNNVGRRDYSISFLPEIRTFDGLDWNSPLSWAGAYRFLKRERPDAVVMQWWTSSVAHLELFLALANRWKLKSSLILEMHEILDPLEARNLPIRLYSRLTGRMIMGSADAFIVHSAPVKEQALKTYHLEDDRVFVIPHGVYDSYLRKQTSAVPSLRGDSQSPIPSPLMGEGEGEGAITKQSEIFENEKTLAKKELGLGSEFVLLYFGMIRQYKGIPCLLEAFNRLPPAAAADSRLIIAGEDWGDEKGLETLVRSSPYSKQITFKPEFVPESAVSRYFSAADAVALPYIRTSGSGVASLAMAYGKPIIVSDLECTRDSLQEYKGAIFVPAGDVSSLSARIAELYELQKSGKALSYDVPTSLTWPHIVSQYADIIDKIKPSPSPVL